MVSITGLLVADGLETVLPVVLLRALVSLCRGWVWAADLRRSRHVAAQNDAVFHHVHGRNCGQPFTYLIAPSVTEAGSAHARGWIDSQSVGVGLLGAQEVTHCDLGSVMDWHGQRCRGLPR
jgi:hypothetical protein